MNIHKLTFLILFTYLSILASCQERAYNNYKFINTDLDTISYDSLALKTFFKKMKELKEGKRKNVVIVQLGDSHLQADFFSGWVRQRLQEDYGNGGRGLIFPYRVAGSNEPNNYHSTSTGDWKGRRCVMMSPSYIPTGVSGFGLRTTDSSSTLKMNIKNGDNLDYTFTRMILLHDKGPRCFDWVVYTSDTFKDSVLIRDSAKEYGVGADSVVFKNPVNSFVMCTHQQDTSQDEAMVFGMIMSNDKPGIIYHTIGSNGARYTDYTNSQFFLEQFGLLKPDLVIISLGTNEAYSKRFNPEDFGRDIDTMLTNIKRVAPGTDFLLTTPNDAYRGHRYKNPDIADAVVTIKNEARKHHAAYWDFYHIMGGFSSIQKWYLKHLAQKDRVHFTVGGYTIQAQLFYDAFKKTISDGMAKLAQ